MFVLIIACATIGMHVLIVVLFQIFVPIVALASRRWQNTYQNRIFPKLIRKKVLNSSIISYNKKIVSLSSATIGTLGLL